MERKQIYWDDVEVGRDIATSYSLELDMTRFCMQVSGTQDYYPVHHDTEFARKQGVPNIFVNTGFLTACVGRLLTDWIGIDGSIKKCTIEMRKMCFLGDVLTVKGKVTDKYTKDAEFLADVDVWCETDKQGITTPCKATVVLPRKP